jgi:hypothetical protein
MSRLLLEEARIPIEIKACASAALAISVPEKAEEMKY